MNVLRRVFPFLTWFAGYSRSTARADLLGGITVALVLVPQSMAYAQLAGLPPYHGLYAAFLPPVVASLFGSSRQLATGPVAVVSLMTAATLEPLAAAGSEAYVAYALLLALLVGGFQLALGVLRLGLVVNFLSHPVVNGFTNAVAIIIATSQLDKIFGVQIDKAERHYGTVYRVVVAAFESTHWPTFGMAVLAFAIIVGLRKVNPRWPNVPAAAVVATVLAWAAGFEETAKAPVAQIAPAEVRDLLVRFNTVTRQKNLMEAHRNESIRAWEGKTGSTRGVCERCHIEPDLDRFGTPSPQLEELATERVTLHSLAGLLDLEIASLADTAAGLRSELRALRFVRDESTGTPMMRAVGALDSGTTDATRWKMSVGGSSLDPDAIVFSAGGAVVGTIPEGLPALSLPRIDLLAMAKLSLAAIIISLLGFMEAISIAKAMAARTRQKLDPNQELIGQGLANMVGCVAQSYPVSGSFSRSAVNLQAGAQTGLSNVISGAVVMVVLLFLAKGLYHLPQAVLAAIIMMAVVGLLNVRGFVHAWRTSRVDGAVSVITFAGVLYFAPHLEWGILTGVVLSLGAYLYRSMRPKVSILAPHDAGGMRDALRHKLPTCRHLAVVGFEGPLNFASAAYLEEEILERVSALPHLKHVVILGGGISEIDASGEEVLRHVVENLRGAKYDVSLAELPDRIVDVLRHSHLVERIGEDHLFSTLTRALATTYGPSHAGSDESDCPFAKRLPPVVELSLHPDGSLRNAARRHLALCRHIAVLRIDGALDFSNSGSLQQQVLATLEHYRALRHVVFVVQGISGIDDVAAGRVVSTLDTLIKQGLSVSLCGNKEDVLETLEASGLSDHIVAGHKYPTPVMAVAGVFPQAHSGSSEVNCPLRGLAPHLVELGVRHDGLLRDASRRNLRLCKHIAILRIEGPLALASRRALQSEFIAWAKQRSTVETVIFAMQAVSTITDAEGAHLVSLYDAVRDGGYQVAFCQFTALAWEVLGRAGILDLVGLENVFPTEAAALAAMYGHHPPPGDDGACPLHRLLPAVIPLSLHPDGSLRNAKRHRLALCQSIVALRLEGPLTFATMPFIERLLRAELLSRPGARHVLIAAHTVPNIDAVAAEALLGLARELRADGYRVYASGLNEDVEATVSAAGGHLNQDGFAGFYPTQASAIEAIHEEAHLRSDEERCPLVEVVVEGEPAAAVAAKGVTNRIS